jgi:hypothetical protein
MTTVEEEKMSRRDERTIKKFLYTLPAYKVEKILLEAESGKMVYSNPDKCLLGLAGHYYGLRANKIARRAEQSYCYIGLAIGMSHGSGDERRMRLLIPVLRKELERRKLESSRPAAIDRIMGWVKALTMSDLRRSLFLKA